VDHPFLPLFLVPQRPDLALSTACLFRWMSSIDVGGRSPYNEEVGESTMLLVASPMGLAFACLLSRVLVRAMLCRGNCVQPYSSFTISSTKLTKPHCMRFSTRSISGE
jgi:hypothetical protein